MDPNVGTIKIYLDKVVTGTTEAYKSFRVSLNDSCSKIVPAVLKKYKINELVSMLKDGEELPIFILKHMRSLYYNRRYPRKAFDIYRPRLDASNGYSPSDHHIAVFEYKAQEDAELDLAVGDRVTVFAREAGWLYVSLRRDIGNQSLSGWVPSECIGVDDIIEGGQGLVLYDFIPQTSSEITARKGEIVSIRRRIDHWFAVELGDKRGWIPASFIHMYDR
ncbi:SH3 and PX domain-containing protein 2B [Phlyctochytrium planicorne]|nr:SH3 and PX domain-containing protein 2B [Phlyctochytrium planicorne]